MGDASVSKPHKHEDLSPDPQEQSKGPGAVGLSIAPVLGLEREGFIVLTGYSGYRIDVFQVQ